MEIDSENEYWRISMTLCLLILSACCLIADVRWSKVLILVIFFVDWISCSVFCGAVTQHFQAAQSYSSDETSHKPVNLFFSLRLESFLQNVHCPSFLSFFFGHVRNLYFLHPPQLVHPAPTNQRELQEARVPACRVLMRSTPPSLAAPLSTTACASPAIGQ